jgi:hypothetical protein
MKQPTVLLSLLATGLLLACVLTGLAVSSHEKNLCRNSSENLDQCEVDECNVVSSPIFNTANSPTPTLAPPRPNISSQAGPASQELSDGQEVFLKFETDNEIEVSLATP